jgi:hypothetical protein
VSAWVLAASAADIVEQAGSYAGLAAVIGLGVMALLYFSQAREVRRLREWAGREPERAAELAQRVQTDPQRRVVAQPLQPTTPAAQQQQATAALYASVGATPPGAIAPAGQLARPAATPAAGLLPAPGGLAPPAVPGGPAPSPGLGAAAAGAAAAAAGAAAAPSAPAAPPTAAPTPGAPPPTPTPTPAPTPSPGLGGPATVTATPAGQPAPANAAAARTAAAQRSGSLSAYANGSPGQDTHESAAARPEPLLAADDDEDGLTMGRIVAYVGGGIAAVVIAVVLMLVLTGGDDTQQPNDFGDTPAQEEGAGAASGAGAGSQGGSGATSASGLSAAERRATKVAVLNGTTQTGLARNVGDKIEKARFTLGKVGNNADQQIPSTRITYTTGNEAAAQAVAKLVGVDAGSVQPADANATAAADADIVVTVGLDQSG